MDDTNVLPLKPLYYDINKLIKSPKILYRTTFYGLRIYYEVTPDGEFCRYAGATGILDKVMPIPKWRLDWIVKWGIERSNEMRDQKALYGTLLHYCCSDYLNQHEFDFGENDKFIKARIHYFKIDNHITFDTSDWLYDLKADIYSFHKFCLNHEVTPLAISLMLTSAKFGFGGEMDMVVEMTIGTGQNGKILKPDIKYDKKTGDIIEDKRKRIKAIVDIKSGKNGFSDQNAAQLQMYYMLWEEFYPEIKIDALFNWAPKKIEDKEDEPDIPYSLKDQTESIEKDNIIHYLGIFKNKTKNWRYKKLPDIFGKLELGQSTDNLEMLTFEERAKKKHSLGIPLSKSKITKFFNEESTEIPVPEIQTIVTEVIATEQQNDISNIESGDTLFPQIVNPNAKAIIDLSIQSEIQNNDKLTNVDIEISSIAKQIQKRKKLEL